MNSGINPSYTPAEHTPYRVGINFGPICARSNLKRRGAAREGLVNPMMAGFLGQIPTRLFSADEVLANYVYVFYAAFLVTFVFTPVVRQIALHFGIIDWPDRARKLRAKPIAYLGG